jgi:phosphatidylglycerol:prolipoprotein diacylglycerol transferase
MNPILFTLGGVEVRWYSALMLTGMLITIIMVIAESKRFNISKDFAFNLSFWVIIIGLIGARCYYVIFNYSLYKDNILDIFKIWEGGLAIHGGLIAGFITLYLYSKRYNVNPFKMTDITVVPLLLAQAIGRWGNFFNHEAHGPMIELATLQKMNIPQFIIDGMFIRGNYYEPTFFYESIWCLSGFIALVTLRLTKKLRISNLTSFYLVWYSIGRFYIESLRTDSLMFCGLKVAQIISICAIIAGIIIFIFSFKKKNKLY